MLARTLKRLGLPAGATRCAMRWAPARVKEASVFSWVIDGDGGGGGGDVYVYVCRRCVERHTQACPVPLCRLLLLAARSRPQTKHAGHSQTFPRD